MRVLALLAVVSAGVLAEDAAYLGVGVWPLSDETRAHYKIPEDVTQGVILNEIREGGAAARAGMRPGDVVTRFDGKVIASVEDLVRAIQGRKAGDKVSYIVRRGTGVIEGSATLGRREPEGEDGAAAEEAPAAEAPRRVEAEMEKRLAEMAARVAELRKRIQDVRARVARAAPRPEPRAERPRALAGWIRAEEQQAEAAAKRGDKERERYHAVRLTVLREMAESGTRIGPTGRLERIEGKLDRILALLEKK